MDIIDIQPSIKLSWKERHAARKPKKTVIRIEEVDKFRNLNEALNTPDSSVNSKYEARQFVVQEGVRYRSTPRLDLGQEVKRRNSVVETPRSASDRYKIKQQSALDLRRSLDQIEKERGVLKMQAQIVQSYNKRTGLVNERAPQTVS